MMPPGVQEGIHSHPGPSRRSCRGDPINILARRNRLETGRSSTCRWHRVLHQDAVDVGNPPRASRMCPTSSAVVIDAASSTLRDSIPTWVQRLRFIRT